MNLVNSTASVYTLKAKDTGTIVVLNKSLFATSVSIEEKHIFVNRYSLHKRI
jgi:hypothetical protein